LPKLQYRAKCRLHSHEKKGCTKATDISPKNRTAINKQGTSRVCLGANECIGHSDEVVMVSTRCFVTVHQHFNVQSFLSHCFPHVCKFFSPHSIDDGNCHTKETRKDMLYYEHNLFHQLHLKPCMALKFRILSLYVHVYNVTLLCIIAMSVTTTNAG